MKLILFTLLFIACAVFITANVVEKRIQREAEPFAGRPRPQQVPPRPPHPRLRREAEPFASRPRPQQVPPRPPHPRLRRETELFDGLS